MLKGSVLVKDDVAKMQENVGEPNFESCVWDVTHNDKLDKTRAMLPKIT